jgi:hypothetical protein
MEPRKDEELLLYIAATAHVVSTAIVVEQREEGNTYAIQRPVYFVSEVLSESKAQYPLVQKLLYALLITSRKLRHYFQEYSISIVTDFPLGEILYNRDATGHICKWAVELGALSIAFKPRTAIKSRLLSTSWRNGGKIKYQLQLSVRNIGSCTSMGPSSLRAPAREYF